MTVRDLIGSRVRILGQAKVTINSATTTSFDFGTPDDLKFDGVNDLRPGERLLVVFSATSAGTTDTVSFVVQDAADNAGSIGTPAAAVTDGTLTGGTGDRRAVTGVRLQAGRPWLRCRVTSTGATDTFVASCLVLAIPRQL